MFSSVENEYIKALLGAYQKQGYNYYLCSTITDNSSDYDLVVYVSTDDISAISSNYFLVASGFEIYIDTSSKSTYNADDNVSINSFSGYVTIDSSEFIYTNADTTASSSTFVNADISVDSAFNDISCLTVVILVMLLSYIILRDILNIGGR